MENHRIPVDGKGGMAIAQSSWRDSLRYFAFTLLFDNPKLYASI
jgi:hypothetical protein